MSILQYSTDLSGQTAVHPRLVRIVCNDDIDAIVSPNWLTQLQIPGYLNPAFYDTDIFFIAYGDQSESVGIFTATVSGSYITLSEFFGNGIQPSNPDLPIIASVDSLGNSVVAGHFAVFQDTAGTIEDGGYSPTQPAATKVVMFNGGTINANYIAVFADTAGTIRGYVGSNAIYPGTIQAGFSSTPGSLISYPAAPNGGYLKLSAYPSPGDYTTTVQNGSMGQNTNFTLYDPGSVQANFMTTKVVPDVGSNLISFDATVTAAALSGGASVNLYFPFRSGYGAYKIRALQINAPGTNFSGGDRLLSITDNTTVYSLIPAANLQSLTNSGWGSTALPYPASAAINTNTVGVVGNPILIAKYSGGTTDYSAGSIVISGMLERVM